VERVVPIDAAVEPLDLPVVADVVEARQILGPDDRQLVLGRGPGAGVEPGDGRSQVVVPQRRERPDETLTGVRGEDK
jgi:hypothetical protein